MSAIDDALSRAAAYAGTIENGSLPTPSSPRLAVLACMDARLHISKILGLEMGEAHVIRNGGGVATEDAIRSLVISQRLLGTREIMLIHHTECGMLTFREDQVKAQIEQETGIRPPFALEAFSNVEADVRQSVARIRSSPFIPHKNQVRGFVYDVHDGSLSEVALGHR